MTVEYLNLYQFDYTHTAKGWYDTTRRFIVLVAASNKDVAKQYVKDQIGINGVDPVLIMNARYPRIWTSDGKSLHPIQAKILTNYSIKIK